MPLPVTVQIIATPVACADGFKDNWRQVAGWVANQLALSFGDQVQVQYYALFEPGCPAVPANTQLPLVLVNGAIFSSGGKIHLPYLRSYLTSLLAVMSSG